MIVTYIVHKEKTGRDCLFSRLYPPPPKINLLHICLILLIMGFDPLGHIPLRHLVYRVHALPESMRPLVWDFGQLNPDIEELYTRQIVSRFVSWHCRSILKEMLFGFLLQGVCAC